MTSNHFMTNSHDYNTKSITCQRTYSTPGVLSVINKEMDQTKQLIIVHDHLLHELDRRGIWSPFGVITGLFASGISIAAMGRGSFS